MDLSTAKDWAAILGPAVAVISLGVNAWMAFLLRRRRTHISRIDEIRTALRTMLDTYDGRLLNIPAFQERWDQGFVSLVDIVKSTGQCNRVMIASPEGLVPQDILQAVAHLHHLATDLHLYQDSFVEFQAGRQFLTADQLTQWPSHQHAVRALTLLQNTYNRKKDQLHGYLRKIS